MIDERKRPHTTNVYADVGYRSAEIMLVKVGSESKDGPKAALLPEYPDVIPLPIAPQLFKAAAARASTRASAYHNQP